MDFSWRAAEGLDRLPHFLTSLGLGPGLASTAAGTAVGLLLFA